MLDVIRQLPPENVGLYDAQDVARWLFSQDCDDLASPLSIIVTSVQDGYKTDMEHALDASKLLCSRKDEVPAVPAKVFEMVQAGVHKCHAQLAVDAQQEVNSFRSTYPETVILLTATSRSIGRFLTNATVRLNAEGVERLAVTTVDGEVLPQKSNQVLLDVRSLPKWLQTGISV